MNPKTLQKAGNKAEILGIRVDSSPEFLLLRIFSDRIKKNRKTFVVTPNPEFIVFAQKNPWFKEILNQADFAIPDGIGLILASRFLAWKSGFRSHLFERTCVKDPRPKHRGYLKNPYTREREKRGEKPSVIQERLSGTDLILDLCERATKHGWSVYLLGGEPGVAKKTLKMLQARYPGLRGWADSGPKKLKIENLKLKIAEKWVQRINQKKPTFLFVAFGMGKQEKFIWDNWNELDIKLAMGIGGAFDYISGKTPRAPSWMRKAGLEWLYRLARQPCRLRRIWQAVVVFPLMVFFSSFSHES